MKPVYKCDYCQYMDTEEKVREHEPACRNNYDRRSCYTCQHKDGFSMKNNLIKYKCKKEIDIPEGKIFEFCESYERGEVPGDLSEYISHIFGW